MNKDASSLKRSNAPIFWLLFGAGGMLSALIGPMLVFIAGIALPLGWLFTPEAFAYANVHAVVSHWLGMALLFAVISLFLWHAGHRLFHSLHDVGIRQGRIARLIFYGGPLIGSILAAIALYRTLA